MVKKSRRTKNYNYSSILRKETSAIFFERFSKKLNENLIKYFGTGEAQRVLKLLERGTLKIGSPETFLYSSENLNDNSLELYKTCESFEDFYYKSVLHLKKRAELGETDIEIREFFLVLVDYLSNLDKELRENEVGLYIKNFLLTLINATHGSPYIIKLIEPRMRKKAEEQTGLNLTYYAKFLSLFLIAYTELTKGRSAISNSFFFPKLEFIFPVYKDTRLKQELYIASLFGVPDYHARSLLKHAQNLSEDSPELRVGLEALASEKGHRELNLDGIILELQRIGTKENFKTYPTGRDFSGPFKCVGVPRSFFLDRRVYRACVNEELYGSSYQPYFANTFIDCSRLSRNMVEQHIDAAKSLSLLKCYFYKYTKNLKNKNYKFKITLMNVTELTQDFVEFIKKKIKKLRSRTNMEFFVEIVYRPKDVLKKVDTAETTHIRVISDIHIDYNKKYNYNFNFGDDFVVNCGDTGSNARECIEWHRSHVKHGIVVAGNHLGYTSLHPELNTPEKFHVDNTKNTQIKVLGNTLYDKDKVLFMSNSITEYQGIIFIGSTLYTDFALYGEEHIEQCMAHAKQKLNEFKEVMVVGHREYNRNPDGTWNIKMRKRSESTPRLLTPQDHAYFFHHSFNFIKEKVMEYRHKPIVVVTHHAPSPYSIGDEFLGDMSNPAFASNLDQYIIDHPEIRLWCHGHVHSPRDYILGETRIVCCPFGNNNQNNWKLPYEYGARIAIADIKNKKKSWKEICQEEIQWGLVKVKP